MMTVPLDKAVTCPVLIGRTRELAALHAFLDETGRGQGRTVLISGEAGIGKSRLVAEVKTAALAQDFLLLQADTSYPYAPLLDLLRVSFANHPLVPSADDQAVLVRELVQMLPDLSLLFPHFLASPRTQTLEPEQQKHRLFTVLTHFFSSQATKRPVLFIIEDVHWCDESSLDLLLHLARHCTRQQLLFLFTYRSEGTSPRLSHWLAQLDREHLALELALRPLSHTEVDSMLQVLFSAPHSVYTELSGTIYPLTKGNPFFVEELLTSLIATGELQYVEEFERARSDYERALAITHTDTDGSLEWQTMMALGLLWAGRDYAQAGAWFLQASELAERLEDPTLRAHSLNRLGNWLVNTGRAEEGLQIHYEALQLFETRADTHGMAETFDLLGTTYGMRGDRVKAVEQFGQAIALFRILHDTQSLISSLGMRAVQAMPGASETTFSSLRTRDECVQDAEEALRLARQIESLAGQAFAENTLAHILLAFGEFGPALSYAQEAMHIATEIEHQQWMVAISYVLGRIYMLLLAPAPAITALEAGLARAQELGSTF